MLVKRIWPNSTIFVLGNGPSLGLIKGSKCFYDKHVIAVNSAFYIGNFVDVLFFGDAKWYWWNEENVNKFKGLKYTLNLCRKDVDKSLEGIVDLNIIKRGSVRGINIDPNIVCFNRSSGGAAVNLAYHLGAKRIVLLGFDMKYVNKKRNYYNYGMWGNVHNLKCDFISGEVIWGKVQVCANDLSIEIVNATPNSALPVIKKVSLKNILGSLK